MGYLVLTRKYRPQNFEEVIGQSHVTRTLKAALKNERVGHAYLFSGPRGVGKTSVARILAKAVNCKEGISENPCNECEACSAITRGNHTDVIEIDGASNRGIDEIRELREAVSYTPSQSRYKVYIIDEVHMLTNEAFNALLKTLEEPPAHVIFVFATTEPQKVPKTVLSRCQRFDFRMLTQKEIFEKLKKLRDIESIKADDRALSLIANRAEGAIRDAEGMLEQLISYSEGKISEEDVREVFGFIGEDLFLRLFRGIKNRDEKIVVRAIEEVVQEGYDLREFTSSWVKFLRKLMLRNLDIEDPTSVEESESLASVSKEVSPEFLTSVLNLSTELQNDIRILPHSPVYLEIAMLRMARIPDIRDINSIIEDFKSINRGEVKGKKEQRKAEVKEPERKEIEESEEADREIWDKIMSSLDSVKGKNFLKAFLQEARFLNYEDEERTLRLEVPANHKFHLKEEIKYLKELCHEATGKELNIEIITSPQKKERKLNKHPKVKRIKEIFNAEEYF